MFLLCSRRNSLRRPREKHADESAPAESASSLVQPKSEWVSLRRPSSGVRATDLASGSTFVALLSVLSRWPKLRASTNNPTRPLGYRACFGIALPLARRRPSLALFSAQPMNGTEVGPKNRKIDVRGSRASQLA